MAAIQVTTTASKNNTNANGDRVMVRTSTGIPYIVAENTTDGSIEVFKGDSSSPTSFTEQDTSNNPDATTIGSVSAAIDSTDKIHIVYAEYVSKSTDLTYVVFDTAANTFTSPPGADISTDLGEEDTSVANVHTGIAIDSADIPHVVVSSQFKVGGTTIRTVQYNNRIGGAWNAAMIEVEGATAAKSCLHPSITINGTNIPVICYLNDTDDDLTRAVGNANDASTWTLTDLDAAMLSGTTNGTSVCVNSAGTIFCAGVDSDNTIIVYNDTTAKDTGISGSSPSLVSDGTDIYVFFEDANNDIAYSKSTDGGTTWSPNGTVLIAGTYNTVKTNSSYWVKSDSTGWLGVNNVSPEVTNEIPQGGTGSSGETNQKIAQSFKTLTTSINEIQIYAEKSNNPTDNYKISIRSSLDGAVIGNEVSVAASSITSSQWVVFTGLAATLTAGSTYFFQMERSGSRDTGNFWYVKSTGNVYGLGTFRHRDNNSWIEETTKDLMFKIGQKSKTELDYSYTDETTNPDIWWDKLTLIAAERRVFITHT